MLFAFVRAYNKGYAILYRIKGFFLGKYKMWILNLLSLNVIFALNFSKEVCVEVPSGNVSLDVIQDTVDWLNNYFHHNSKLMTGALQKIPNICHLKEPANADKGWKV